MSDAIEVTVSRYHGKPWGHQSHAPCNCNVKDVDEWRINCSSCGHVISYSNYRPEDQEAVDREYIHALEVAEWHRGRCKLKELGRL